MKVWRIIIVVGVIFMSMISGMAWAGDKFVKGIIHAHDTNSDGLFPQTLYRPWFKMTGCKYFYQTDHFDCLIGKCDHKSHQKRDSSYVLNYLKQQTNPYFRGIECFTELNGQHILLLGTDWTNIKSLHKADTGKILAYAKNNNLVSILAHPHDGYKLEYLNEFTALEFFNTKGYEITNLAKRIKNEKYERAESIDLDIYCMAIKYYCNDYFPGTGLKTKNVPGIVGGCDLHASELELSFGQTFIAVSNTKAISLLTINDAVMNGKTCAVFSSIPGLRAWIDKLNYSPNRENVYKVSQIVLKGKITAENCNKLDIYLDGYFNKSLKINKGAINFNETIATKKGRHVVFLYAKHRLITSPIIFDVIENPTQPTPAFSPTPILVPTVSEPVAVKPKKFIEELKFVALPESITGGGEYNYIVRDEDGRIVFRHKLGRHDCVALLGNLIVIAFPVNSSLDNLSKNDFKSYYYGQCFIYDKKFSCFKYFYTLGGTTNRFSTQFSQAQHAILNKKRNKKICFDIVNTFNKYVKSEIKVLKTIKDPLLRQLMIFTKTLSKESYKRYFLSDKQLNLSMKECKIYKEYASALMLSDQGFGYGVIFKNEGNRWRMIYVNSVKIISVSDPIPDDVLKKFGWRVSIPSNYPEYSFRH